MLAFLLAQAGRSRALGLANLAASGALVWLLAGNSDVAAVYTDLQSFEKRQQARGFVIVGRFGRLTWPALVVARDAGSDGVTFTTADGQRHSYQGFKGPIKSLTLRTLTGAENHFVLVLQQAPSRRESTGVKNLH